MKMYKYLLESISDINWLALVPLFIFFIFFVCMVIYVMRTKKSHLDRMSELPLGNNIK